MLADGATTVVAASQRSLRLYPSYLLRTKSPAGVLIPRHRRVSPPLAATISSLPVMQTDFYVRRAQRRRARLAILLGIGLFGVFGPAAVFIHRATAPVAPFPIDDQAGAHTTLVPSGTAGSSESAAPSPSPGGSDRPSRTAHPTPTRTIEPPAAVLPSETTAAAAPPKVEPSRTGELLTGVAALISGVGALLAGVGSIMTVRLNIQQRRVPPRRTTRRRRPAPARTPQQQAAPRTPDASPTGGPQNPGPWCPP